MTNDVQYEFTFHFLNNESENDFKSIVEKQQNISVRTPKEEISSMSFFGNRKARLNFDYDNVLIALITGGSLTAIIRSLRDIIIEYMKKSKVDLTIERGNRKIKIISNDKIDLEELINEELINELFVFEDGSENQ